MPFPSMQSEDVGHEFDGTVTRSQTHFERLCDQIIDAASLVPDVIGQEAHSGTSGV